MLSRSAEENYFINSSRARMTCYNTSYPFGLFRDRDLPEFCFNDITIFCGNNGSGKSSILNVIAEKLMLERSAPFNRTDFFEDYVAMCKFQIEPHRRWFLYRRRCGFAIRPSSAYRSIR